MPEQIREIMTGSSVTMTPQLWKVANTIADSLNISVSAILRIALVDYASRYYPNTLHAFTGGRDASTDMD